MILTLAALIAIAAIGGAIWRVSSAHTQQRNVAVSRDSSLQRQIASLRASVVQKDSIIGALTGMHTRVIDLVSYASAQPMARMFWDQQTKQWTMYASHVSQPAPGHTYQLWVIRRDNPQPVSVGTFSPDSSGSVTMTGKLDIPPGMLRRVAVTDEPGGGVDAPTGPMMFVSAAR